ncbi:Vacuolar protein sorting protein 26 related [Dillenia turbinata]|uniref:Vacuolar protein sorting protein 26 related n=1 Tax=Dillenia turbinata TaxID=194707 RepID=A0AAN8V4H4_9MAGN
MSTPLRKLLKTLPKNQVSSASFSGNFAMVRCAILKTGSNAIGRIDDRNKSLEIKSSGKITSGVTEMPFSVVLRQHGEENLEKFYETFHDVNISIRLTSTVEFIVENDNLLDSSVSPEMVIFYITQDTQRHSLLPEVKSGLFLMWLLSDWKNLHSVCSPITGELTVEASAVPIHSIDIHLFRADSVLVGEMIVTETTLVQTMQIADGDVSVGT